MPDPLVEALQTCNLPAARAALRTTAISSRAVLTAGGRAFTKGLALLHKHGADMNALYRGYRPLHALLQEEPHAAAGKPTKERLACLDWLLAHGADPELTGAWPPPRAIIIAAFVGEPEYVKRLRKAGAKIDGFAAAALGDRKLVEKTLGKRSKFARERDSGGLTALQCAAGTRYPKADPLQIARLLLDAGADLRARTKSWSHEVDAMYFAVGANHKAVVDLFLERGGDATEALSHALWRARFDFAEMALAHDAVPDRAESGGRPLLNDMIRWGQIPATMWLLAHQANPNLADSNGWTAVHQAASRGNERMMRAVLDAGGDASRRDKQGRTPLDIAKLAKRPKLAAMM